MLDVALKLLKKIESYGYQAYIVGGFVRDYVLDIESNDIDIATNATPKQLIEIFPESYLPHDDYGSVTVMSKNIRFDITTFRREISYINNRKPNEIEYINDLYSDLLRRDFTINTICMNSNSEMIDYLGGKDDLNNQIIRTVGNAKDKFIEDALRILRAIRFATILDFELDKDIILAIKETKYLLKNLSYNRKKEELDKIFTSGNAKHGIELLLKFGLDEDLELFNLNKVTNTSSSIAIWSVLDVISKYPFTSSEKELINNIHIVMSHNNLDPYILYNYGLYVNSVCADIKNIDKKDVTKAYNELVIHSRKDLDITSADIMESLHKEPGSYLKDIYCDIEKSVLYKKIPNQKKEILNYIVSKY